MTGITSPSIPPWFEEPPLARANDPLDTYLLRVLVTLLSERESLTRTATA